jgi:hypothetical protein
MGEVTVSPDVYTMVLFATVGMENARARIAAGSNMFRGSLVYIITI